MKKFFIAIMLVMFASLSASANTSDDIYLRQDVFNAKMDAFMAEIKLMNQDMRSEFKQDIQNTRSELKQDIQEITKAIAVLSERTDRNFEILSARIDGVNSSLSAQIDAVNSRVDDLRNGLYLWLVVIGTFFSLVGIVLAWPKAKNFLQNRNSHRKFLTLEDVERLIDARLNSKTQ